MMKFLLKSLGLAVVLVICMTFINGLTSNGVNAAAAVKRPKVKPTIAVSPTPSVLVTPTINPEPATDIVRGVNYNPISIGAQTLDASAPIVDVKKITEMGANVIGTYNAGLFEWGNLSDINVNVPFYTALANQADAYEQKVIVGYFSNETIDWTNSTRLSKVTSQYQELVATSQTHPSTYMMLIGNELFEKLPNDTSRRAYATWVGQMTRWTHQNYPGLQVTYADNHAMTALPLLKQYAPELDVYSINTYEWTNANELVVIIDRVANAWSGKPILLHEWGVDSWDGNNQTENRSAQASRVAFLAGEIEEVVARRPILLGGVYFEYSDQWDKDGSIHTQDEGAANWRCMTCFDGIAHEDYWGLTTNTVAGQAQNRQLKSAYTALQNYWSE